MEPELARLEHGLGALLICWELGNRAGLNTRLLPQVVLSLLCCGDVTQAGPDFKR